MTSTIDRPILVTDEGEGPAVVMLHGLGGTSSMFQPQADALVADHRVIRVDLPGSGLSRAAGPLDVAGWTEAVADVLEERGVEGATWVSHSLSTFVAVRAAVRSPHLVRSLVLTGPVRAQPPRIAEATRQRAGLVRDRGMPAVVDGVLAAAVSDGARRERPVVAAFVRASLLAQDPEGYAASCEALAAAAEPAWAEVAVPVVLVAGDDDRLATPATVDAIEQLLPGARRVRVPGAGHWLSIEAPAAVTDAVRGIAATAGTHR